MANPLLLSGDVDNRDEMIADLEAEVEGLKAQLAHEKQAGREGARAVAALRKQLTPLYQALQMVFGQMEAVTGADVAPAGHAAAHDPRVSAVWASWKSKMPGQAAQVIDALLLHGEMNTQQIAIAIGCHRNTVPNLIFKLNKAGLLNKNGGRFSLKQL